MLFTSPLISAASGAIAGLVASRNAAGNYFRARTVPVDPQTVLQVDVRTLLGQFANRWGDFLSAAQRVGWEDYASNVALPARLGGTHFVSGIAMYIRSNIARRQAGMLRIDDAPVVFDVGEFSPIENPTVLAAGNVVGATFDDTDAWANETGSSMLVYTGIAINASRRFFKGPWRFASRVDGDTTTPPTSPFAITSNYPYALGQQGFFRVVIARKDGRFSFDQKISAVAA